MNISGLTPLPLPAWLQKLETSVISSLGASTPFSTSSAGDAQSSSASSATPTSAATAPSTPSSQFAPDLLSALLSTQNAPPSAASVASGMISQLDSNGDGSLNLAEVMQAVTGQGSSTGAASSQAPASTAQSVASDAVASAFAKLDTNGDGQLSSSELAAAITNLNQEASSLSGHHHHHHHADETQQASTSASASTTGSTPASSTTTAGASGATSSAAAVASAN